MTGYQEPKRRSIALYEQENSDKFSAALKIIPQKEHERIQARDAIYSAISKWVDQDVREGDDFPLLREGKPTGKMWQEMPHLVDQVEKTIWAAELKDTAELKKLMGDYKKILQCSSELTKQMRAMGEWDLFGLSSKKPKYDMETKVIRALGTVPSAFVSLDELKDALEYQIENISNKLKNIDNVRGRPRNEAAHGVALGLAKLYSGITGKKPTYSEGPSGLSGQYTPALKDVFIALGWEETSLKGPAETAIKNINADGLSQEIKPSFTGLLSPNSE
jgi:hypothetical protein